MNREDFRILLTLDKDNRLLTVSDNGIGMTREELEQNLGTIAHSGSQDFKAENTDENIDIIGQFGVGFYSAFMVADHVTVISKAYGSAEAWQWESSGVEGYEITPAEKETAGTDIILHIKPNTDTENYDNYVSEYGVAAIVKKYSDYIRYPIQMERTKSREKPAPDPKPDDYKPEWEEYTELETLNSMVPIWKKQKSEVTDEAATTPTPPGSSSAAPRVPPTTTPCSLSPPTVLTTTTPRSMRRGWPCTPRASSSWTSAPTCCPITSALSRASWTART